MLSHSAAIRGVLKLACQLKPLAEAKLRSVMATVFVAPAALAFRSVLTHGLVPAAITVVLVWVPAAAAIAAPTVGDFYVYRVGNGYISGSDLGKLRYKIEKIGADRIEVSVAVDNPRVGFARSEIYTKEGNWMRRQINNHDQAVDYEFAAPFPAYMFPLEPGKTWSLRVDATALATGKPRSIRIDGEVVGVERVSVPAGTFETLKVRRRVYAGDRVDDRSETTITETDWYSPALSRPVRSESKSEWMDHSRCSDSCQPQLGDWLVYELVQVSPPRP